MTEPCKKDELRVVKKRAMGRYSHAFRKMAVKRLASCDNVVALSKELGVHRRLLYKWRIQLQLTENGGVLPAKSLERKRRLPVALVVRLVANRTLEVEFAREVLQRIQARRQSPRGQTASVNGSAM